MSKETIDPDQWQKIIKIVIAVLSVLAGALSVTSAHPWACSEPGPDLQRPTPPARLSLVVKRKDEKPIPVEVNFVYIVEFLSGY